MERRRILALAMALLAACSIQLNGLAVDPYGPKDAKITIIVLDPMALPLACDCVQGYAQRKYEKLADYMQASLRESVRVVWAESLTKALEDETQAAGKATIIIGKDSVVRAGAKSNKLSMVPVAHLTDMNGGIMQHGLFVVRSDDKAATLLDVEGYKFLWGPNDCDEKSAAPKAKLAELELEHQDGNECASCSVAAKQLMAEPADAKLVAVISSYAEPLLAGCGTIKKGDLKVIGKSDEVPFVAAFVDSNLPKEKARQITEALLAMKSPEMLTALETKKGFVEYSAPKSIR